MAGITPALQEHQEPSPRQTLSDKIKKKKKGARHTVESAVYFSNVPEHYWGKAQIVKKLFNLYFLSHLFFPLIIISYSAINFFQVHIWNCNTIAKVTNVSITLRNLINYRGLNALAQCWKRKQNNSISSHAVWLERTFNKVVTALLWFNST